MAAEKANCVLGMIKGNIKCKNAAIIMRLYKNIGATLTGVLHTGLFS